MIDCICGDADGVLVNRSSNVFRGKCIQCGKGIDGEGEG